MATESAKLERAPFLADQEERGGLWQTLKSPTSDKQRSIRQYFLLGLNIVLLLISAGLNFSTLQSHNQEESGPPRCVQQTEMRDAWSAVEYEERFYTGALVYDAETKRVVRKADGEQEYFGPPSKALDDAWDQLLRGEFPSMTDEEASDFLPELKRIPMTDLYHFEPDVTHTLHCLNAVRMEVSKTLYNSTAAHKHHSSAKLPTGWDAAHMEHCMDRLRQSVMCSADLTPSPLYYWEGFNIALGRTGKRTCRKWEPIRAWIDDRGKRAAVLGGT
ncbi:Putative mycotoxin biosynthesis protein UstYa [Septoria linicola]|uniref:Mycotoxin biosynthesis protein UstYa n=1 Tax=Septoria linicola TaxID=215465 RepID=A0A9Q9B979_9PEZI|nr:Putative mycotoxin biosynthesis protein UstYa [Septoria linicola]